MISRRGFFSALGSGALSVVLPPGSEVVAFDPYTNTYSTGDGLPPVTMKDLVEMGAHLRSIDRRYDEGDADFRVRLYQAVRLPTHPFVIISAP